MKKCLLLILAFAMDSGLAGDETRFCAADFWTTAIPRDVDLLENPNFWCKDSGFRLIHRAVFASTGVFQAFLEKRPVLNIPDREGGTALILAAKSRTPLLANIELLVGAGAELELQDKMGNSALIWAAEREHSEVVEALINAGADPNLQNSRGDFALKFAARRGHAEMVRVLINAGADPNLQTELGITALTWAAVRRYSEIIDALVSAGADLDVQNKVGDTALIWVSALGHSRVVRALVKAGANLNIKKRLGPHCPVEGGCYWAFGNRRNFNQSRSRFGHAR